MYLVQLASTFDSPVVLDQHIGGDFKDDSKRFASQGIRAGVERGEFVKNAGPGLCVLTTQTGDLPLGRRPITPSASLRAVSHSSISSGANGSNGASGHISRHSATSERSWPQARLLRPGTGRKREGKTKGQT